MINFRIACLVSCIVCLVLFAILLVAPGNYVAGYGASADAGAEFMGRRAAPIFLGLTLMCGLLRGNLHVDVQWSVSLSMIFAFLGTAIVSVWAFVEGAASQTILIAAGGELLLALVFVLSLRRPG